jgi:hypothetical protein
MDRWLKETAQVHMAMRVQSRSALLTPESSEESGRINELYVQLRNLEYEFCKELIRLEKCSADDSQMQQNTSDYTSRYNSLFQ